MRGRDLTGDLMGRLSFTEYFHLLLTGREPTEDQRFFLDLLLVAIAEHGMMPTNVAARMTLAADPASLQGAVAAGILTILNNYVPGGEYLDKGFMLALGIGCILLGLVVLRLPWSRWPRWTELTLPVISFGLIALANNAGGVSAYTFGTFFVFVFVWIGMAQPPGMETFASPRLARSHITLIDALGFVRTASTGDWSCSTPTRAISALDASGATSSRLCAAQGHAGDGSCAASDARPNRRRRLLRGPGNSLQPCDSHRA